MSPTAARSFRERFLGAVFLKNAVFAEVSEDHHANGQAFVVVLLSGIFNGFGMVPRLGSWGVSVGVGAALMGWLLWTAILVVIARVLRLDPRGRSLLRALAFANAPGILLVVGVVPIVGVGVRALVVLWMLTTSAVAVQAVYQVTRRRAVMIAVLAFATYLLAGFGIDVWVDAPDSPAINTAAGVSAVDRRKLPFRRAAHEQTLVP